MHKLYSLENTDDCPGNECQNNATCVDKVNEYACLCNFCCCCHIKNYRINILFIDFRTQKSYNSNIVAYLSSYCQVRDPSLTTKPPLTTQQLLQSSQAPEAVTKLIITPQTAKDSDISLLMLIALSATLLVSVIPLSIILVCLIKRKSRRPHIEMTKTVLVSSRIYQGLFQW